MASLYITEFALAGADGNGKPAQVAHQPPLAEQKVTFTDTSAASSAFNASTALVRLQADAACSVLFGAAPTATAASMPLAAGAPEYFSVPIGASIKVAAITN